MHPARSSPLSLSAEQHHEASTQPAPAGAPGPALDSTTRRDSPLTAQVRWQPALHGGLAEHGPPPTVGNGAEFNAGAAGPALATPPLRSHSTRPSAFSPLRRHSHDGGSVKSLARSLRVNSPHRRRGSPTTPRSPLNHGASRTHHRDEGRSHHSHLHNYSSARATPTATGPAVLTPLGSPSHLYHPHDRPHSPSASAMAANAHTAAVTVAASSATASPAAAVVAATAAAAAAAVGPGGTLVVYPALRWSHLSETAPASAAGSGFASPTPGAPGMAASQGGTPTHFYGSPQPTHTRIAPSDRAKPRRLQDAAQDLSRVLGAYSPLGCSPDIALPYPPHHHGPCAAYPGHPPGVEVGSPLVSVSQRTLTQYHSPSVAHNEALARRLRHETSQGQPSPLHSRSPALLPIEAFVSAKHHAPEDMAVDSTLPVESEPERMRQHGRLAPASKPTDNTAYTPEALRGIPFYDSHMAHLSLSESPGTTMPVGVGDGGTTTAHVRGPADDVNPLTLSVAASTSGGSDMES
jgi:hypothetical protein